MSDPISRQVLDLWNRYKPTIAVDAIEYDRELRQLLGTNLASLGTDCISRQAAIDVNGLDEEIRCGMCKNPMSTDQGCDGNCKYDEILYEKIIQILNKRITPLPSAQPETHNKRTETHECDLISRQAAIMHFVKVSKNYECGMFDLKEVTHELYELPSAQPKLARINDCNGCKFIGCYDTDFPCANCVRKDKDYYEPEG